MPKQSRSFLASNLLSAWLTCIGPALLKPCITLLRDAMAVAAALSPSALPLLAT
jgi:hypothetical protein